MGAMNSLPEEPSYVKYNVLVNLIEVESATRVYNRIMETAFTDQDQLEILSGLIFEKAIKREDLSFKLAQLVQQLKTEKYTHHCGRSYTIREILTLMIIDISSQLMFDFYDEVLTPDMLQYGKALIRFLGNLYSVGFYSLSEVLHPAVGAERMDPNSPNREWLVGTLTEVMAERLADENVTVEQFHEMIKSREKPKIVLGELNDFGNLILCMEEYESSCEDLMDISVFKDMSKADINTAVRLLVLGILRSHEMLFIFRDLALKMQKHRPELIKNFLSTDLHVFIERYEVIKDIENRENVMKFEELGLVIYEFFKVGLVDEKVVEHILEVSRTPRMQKVVVKEVLKGLEDILDTFRIISASIEQACAKKSKKKNKRNKKTGHIGALIAAREQHQAHERKLHENVENLIQNSLECPQSQIEAVKQLDEKSKELLVNKCKSMIEQVKVNKNLVEFVAELYNSDIVGFDFINGIIEHFLNKPSNELSYQLLEILLQKCGMKMEKSKNPRLKVFFKFFEFVVGRNEATDQSSYFKRFIDLRDRSWQAFNSSEDFYEHLLMTATANDTKVKELTKSLRQHEQEVDKFIKKLWKVLLKEVPNPVHIILCTEISKSNSAFGSKLTTFLTARCEAFKSLSDEFYSTDVKSRLGKVVTFVAELNGNNMLDDEILEMWIQPKLFKKVTAEFKSKILSSLKNCQRIRNCKSSRILGLIGNKESRRSNPIGLRTEGLRRSQKHSKSF
jgi:hypothetical protein